MALSGFFVSGLLLAFPGAVLPAWGYHIQPNYSSIGNYFLAVGIGLIAGTRVASAVLRRSGTGRCAALGCVAAFAALLGLALTAPPVGEAWRLPGFLGLGLGAAMLNTAILHAISPTYRLESAATVNLAGLFFGLGSLFATLLLAMTLNVYTVASMVVLFAMVPAFAAVLFSRTRFPIERSEPPRSAREVARQFTMPGGVLFSVLLFVHSGNEWAVAGWLPLFLTQRLGVSPEAALLMLAGYWSALVTGRIAAQAILPRARHSYLLVGSVAASLVGCLMLAFTDNRFGAWMGSLLMGLGFAPIYPIVVEKIGAKFPHSYAGFFTGIFSIALTGGTLAPAILGYAADLTSVRIVMALPAAGTAIVFLLVLLIWVEAKVTRLASAKAQHNRG